MMNKNKLYSLLLMGVLGCGPNSPQSGETLSSTSVETEPMQPISAKRLSTGKVGLSAVPQNYQDTRENWLKLFNKAKESGVQILSAGNGNWDDEIEPAPGAYNWESFDRLFRIAEKNGFDFEYSFDMFGVFFHDKIKVPSHVTFISFTEPVFLDRFKKLLTSFLDRFGKKISYMVIHAEGAVTYFDIHPDELDDYCHYLDILKGHIKRHSPHIKFGINTSPDNKDFLLKKIGQHLDFISFDFMKNVGGMKKPAGFEKVIQRLTRLAGGKKIAIQNGGWSTSEVDGSNEEQQVEFIQEYYRVLFKYRNEIEYASYHLLFDDDYEFMRTVYRAMFPEVSDSYIDKLTKSNIGFGVFRSDGTPKPGWPELRKQIKRYYKLLED